MPRALSAAFALLAGSCSVLAAVDAFHALNAVRVARAFSDPAAWSGTWVARDAATALSGFDGVLLLAGCGMLAALAVTRRLDVAHKRAVLVSVGLLGAAVIAGVAVLLVPGSPADPWGPLAVARALPLLLVPVALVWPHRSARALGVVGASLTAGRVLALGWASDAHVRASGFTSVGAPVPDALVAWIVLPFVIGALGFTCWAAAFAVAAGCGAREGKGRAAAVRCPST